MVSGSVEAGTFTGTGVEVVEPSLVPPPVSPPTVYVLSGTDEVSGRIASPLPPGLPESPVCDPESPVCDPEKGLHWQYPRNYRYGSSTTYR